MKRYNFLTMAKDKIIPIRSHTRKGKPVRAHMRRAPKKRSGQSSYEDYGSYKFPAPHGTSLTIKQTPKTRELKASSPEDLLSAGLKQQIKGSKASTSVYVEANYITGKKRFSKKL